MQIEQLTNQLETKDDEIFTLQMSLASVEAEASHRTQKAEGEAANRVRLVEDRLRLVQREADSARAGLVRERTKRGKGGGSGGVELCKAKGCQTESKSFQYCKPCHRKGIESGFITRKDGSKDDIKDRTKGGDGNGFSKKDIRGLKALIKLDKDSDKKDEFDLRSKLSGAGPVSELKKRAARAVREADQAEHEAKKQRLIDELQALEDDR